VHDDGEERAAFLKSMTFDWIPVGSVERDALKEQLKACIPWLAGKQVSFDSENWFKVCHSILARVCIATADSQVPWYTVPDLVGQRKVFIKHGMAYVPQTFQISLVLQAFESKLEAALEVSSIHFDKAAGRDADHSLLPKTCLA
jgi:DNA primase large subunit